MPVLIGRWLVLAIRCCARESRLQAQARDARDTMAKTIYDHLFAWLVYVLSGSASVTLALWLFLSPFCTEARVFPLEHDRRFRDFVLI